MNNNHELIEFKVADEFGSSIMKLITGNVLAQLVVLLSMPIITRLYMPGDLGILQLFVSISTVIIFIASLRYEVAIMLPPDDENAVNIVVVAAIIMITTTVLTYLTILLFRNSVSQLLEIDTFNDYLHYIPLFVFSGALLRILQFWSSRQKKFGRIAFTKVISTSSTSILKIGGGIIAAGAGTLIWSQIIGSFIGSIILLGKSITDARNLKHIKYEKIKYNARLYRNFSFFSSWSAFFNTASKHVPVFLLAFFFPPVVVGYFALAFKAVSVPLELISEAIGRVFFQKAVEEDSRPGSLSIITIAVLKRLVAVSFFPMVVIIIIGQGLFSIIFGPKWAEAGMYMQCFSLWLFLKFLVTPITSVFIIKKKQDQLLLIDIIYFFSTTSILIISGKYSDPLITMFLLGTASALVFLIYLFRISSLAEVQLVQFIKIIAEYAIYSLPGVIILCFIQIYRLGDLQVIIGLFLGTVVYLFLVIKNDNQLLMIIKKNLRLSKK